MEKILIIEDAKILRESIVDSLLLEGFEVIQAENGNNGILMAQEQNPDLILCDIMMPDMSGYDVLQVLNSDNSQNTCPFIFTTALGERENIREGMDLGADDYLVKPFTINELLKAINTRLHKRLLIETQIRSKLEKIEAELKAKSVELNELIKNQQLELAKVYTLNTQITKQLSDHHAKLMEDVYRSNEINSSLRVMNNELTEELQKPDLPTDRKKVIVKLRSKIRNRSVLKNSWTLFQMKFDQIYPHFKERVTSKFKNLTQQDIVIISATFINMDTEQLSLILCISRESVRKKRYRLKMKLGLGIDVDLAQFIHEID
ncbi:MAG: response regulator [Mariniphaga sp.]